MSAPINILLKPNNPYNDDNNEYQYQLKVFYKNGIIKSFKKNLVEKYCNIIDKNDNVLFHEIKMYQLIITINVFDKYVIQNDFNLDYDDGYQYQDENIYIEFIKNGKYAVSNCYLKNQNTNTIIFTPPNY